MSTQIVLQGQDAGIPTDLYMSFELGDKKWQLTLSDGRRGPSRYSVGAGDTAAVMQCIGKARERCKLDVQSKFTAATKLDATAGGYTAGWSSKASTTLWSTRRALK